MPKQYPTMTYRDYINKYAYLTRNGQFHCDLCNQWINHQRWTHFKTQHRYKRENNEVKPCQETQQVL